MQAAERTDNERINEHTLEKLLSDDPAEWPSRLSNNDVQYLVQNKPHCRKQLSYPKDNNDRSFSNTYFTRTFKNGEVYERSWLLYSPSQNRIFCFCCKLFANCNSILGNDGFCDWQHASRHLSRHEKGEEHIQNFKKWTDLTVAFKTERTIDQHEQRILQTEQKHWYSVIERILHVVKFLAKQNLAFRGSSNKLFESNNGNFLKAIEMISHFDPVMSEHILRIQQRKNDEIMPTYLGNIIQNEIISLVANKIQSTILDNARQAKYFSVILDCTPDVSHTEQITVIIRFVIVNADTKMCECNEHFLGFYPINDSTGEGLTTFLFKILKDNNLNIQDLRGQSYDNGANMRGKYRGVQKRVLDINPRAFFVPCAAHSLNLVVSDAAKVNLETVDFFSTVQALYNFFSGSTKRWDVLKQHLIKLTLKSVSETRWESRIEAIKPLRYELGEIYDALIELMDSEMNIQIRHEAQCLTRKLCSFKFVCLIVIWYEILSKVNIISKMLQDPEINISSSAEILQDLVTTLTNKRSDEEFEDFVARAKELAEMIEVDEDFPNPVKIRPRKKTKQFNYEHRDETISDPKKNFKINFYFCILDIAISSLNERFELLKQHNETFYFLRHSLSLKEMNKEHILKQCMNLQAKLSNETGTESDIDGAELYDEICILQEMLTSDMNSNAMLNYLLKNNLQQVFPNFYVSLRILLTLPVTVASGERSFSKLKLIKNYCRSTMSQERLTNLATISIEHEIANKLETPKLIKEFAKAKARRAHFI